jgi:hypothetical protein
MIIVTGTKRSGTSMWMQILRAAGYPTIGEAFPRDWERTIRAANSEGFYESPLRSGVYYATNPNPRTGAYLSPAETRRSAVKVFVPGLVRSDLAFVDRVIATMRNVREYVRSLERLYRMERESKLEIAREKGKDPLPAIEHMQPALEWWNDNYRLLCDALVRRYPLHMVSYEAVLQKPEQVVSETLAWLDGGLGAGDQEKALAEVRTFLRTQRDGAEARGSSGLSPDVEQVCDELYARVHEQRPLDAAFIARLNHTHQQLEPAIKVAEAHAKQSRQRVRALREAHKKKAHKQPSDGC